MELNALQTAKSKPYRLARLTLGARSRVEATSEQHGDRIPDALQVALPSISGANTNRWRERAQFTALCWTLFLGGWNDGTIGPLLPRVRLVYDIGFAIVSLIFVFSCVGFMSGAVMNVYVSDKVGFGRMIVLGSLCQIVAYSLQASALPFPVLVSSYVINGIGMAVQDAQANGYVAALKHNSATKMGMLHACYGAGALCAPLVSTQFAQLERWSFHFLVSLGIAITNTLSLFFVFKLKSKNECLLQVGQAVVEEQGTSEHSPFRQIMSNRTVHLLALFILVYVGIGVTIGGWIVEYVIDVRGGGASSGYVSAGFFGGIMLGRVALLWLNELVGERRVLFFYMALAIGFEFVVWFVPSLVGDAVAVAIVGILLGPMYPITVNHASRVLPRWLLTGAVGWIASFGQAGSALFPVITAALASKFGIKSLQPLLVALMGLAMSIWWAIPARVLATD